MSPKSSLFASARISSHSGGFFLSVSSLISLCFADFFPAETFTAHVNLGEESEEKYENI